MCGTKEYIFSALLVRNMARFALEMAVTDFRRRNVFFYSFFELHLK